MSESTDPLPRAPPLPSGRPRAPTGGSRPGNGRPGQPTPPAGAAPAPPTTPAPPPPPPPPQLGIPPNAFMEDPVTLNTVQMQPRSNLSQLLMLTMFFFFMSNGNTPAQTGPVFGPDGELHERVTELQRAQTMMFEYEGYLNGTGNWTEPPQPALHPAALLPTPYVHSEAAASGSHFFPNMTGWYRKANVTTIDLLQHSRTPVDGFFDGVHIPDLNTTEVPWNETRAVELRGDFDWADVTDFDMNIKEWVPPWPTHSAWSNPGEGQDGGAGDDEGGDNEDGSDTDADPNPDHSDSLPYAKIREEWAWVKGSFDLYTSDGAELDYKFFGLHYIPNGTYELYALPDGVHIDYRILPTLFPQADNTTAQIVLAHLQKEYQVQQDSFVLTEVKEDEYTGPLCPLLVHLSLPPLPDGVLLSDVSAYDDELANPTGILTSLTRPPRYWETGAGLGGVIIADGCGFAMGINKGRGVPRDDFNRKTVNYTIYATVSQLVVLLLLVRQMESTRTPSTLAKVSLWTIVLIGVSDSWIFSAHLVIGLISDNKTSLPMFVPAFFALCTAIVFGPRYAVVLHRIQAPENSSPPPTTTTATGDATEAGGGTAQDAVSEDDEETAQPFWRTCFGDLRNIIVNSRGLKFFLVLLALFVIWEITLFPSVTPFILFAMHSIWVPQIYRNARRGTTHALTHEFILGVSIGRLALPIYAFACPDNVFFVNTGTWIYAVALWSATQILMLFAQERFGPAFFLPKRFAPSEGYNYHPIIPPPDPENPAGAMFEGGTTCSICMEEVDLYPTTEDSSAAGSSVLSGLNRKNYAVAPCHHLFHTKCLSQWLAIKTICPLCKRSLPPL